MLSYLIALKRTFFRRYFQRIIYAFSIIMKINVQLFAQLALTFRRQKTKYDSKTRGYKGKG
jgi:hypothetical protein